MLRSLTQALSALGSGLDLVLHPIFWLALLALVIASAAVLGALATGRWSESRGGRMARVEMTWTVFTAALVIGLASGALVEVGDGPSASADRVARSGTATARTSHASGGSHAHASNGLGLAHPPVVLVLAQTNGDGADEPTAAPNDDPADEPEPAGEDDPQLEGQPDASPGDMGGVYAPEGGQPYAPDARGAPSDTEPMPEGATVE
jgi:hypothetical protein